MSDRALVLYLEEILAAAREGRVQFFVAAAGVSGPPSDPRYGGSFDVHAHAALGPLVGRYDPVSRHQAYTTTLSGLAEAVAQLNATLKEQIKPVEGSNG